MARFFFGGGGHQMDQASNAGCWMLGALTMTCLDNRLKIGPTFNNTCSYIVESSKSKYTLRRTPELPHYLGGQPSLTFPVPG